LEPPSTYGGQGIICAPLHVNGSPKGQANLYAISLFLQESKYTSVQFFW